MDAPASSSLAGSSDRARERSGSGLTQCEIRVHVRPRPFPNRGSPCNAVEVIPHRSIRLPAESKDDSDGKPYQFDWVFEAKSVQAEVFHVIGEPLSQGVLQGFHGNFVAYGPAGSGKSYSVFGHRCGDGRGQVARIVERLLLDVGPGEAKAPSLMRISYLEACGGRLRDCLRPQGPTATRPEAPVELEVRQHPRVGAFIPGLTEAVVRSPEDLTRLLDFGHAMRAIYGRGHLGATASRAHAIFTLNLERKMPAASTRSTLRFFDLAGSDTRGRDSGLAALHDLVMADQSHRDVEADIA